MARNQVFSSRFSNASWLLKEKKPIITVGGAGGIGSWVLFFLSRTDNYDTVYLYEYDTIDETNIAGQFFRPSDVGRLKDSAIISLMNEFSNSNRVVSLGKFEKEKIVSDYVITGFDNMKARKEMFETWESLDTRELFIDGRMLFEDGQIYVVTKGNEEKYKKTLFNDEDIKSEACSLKATTHTGAHIASLIIAFFNNYIANKYYYKDDILTVPFKYVFSFPPLLIETDV